MKQLFKTLLFALTITLSGYSATVSATENELAGDMCPDANILSGIIDRMCWSCLLPIRMAGIGDAPTGAAPDSPFCMCFDEALGLPEIGLPIGYFEPSRLVSYSPTPYCMPSLSGSRLSDDITLLGNLGTESTQEMDDKSFMHYKYWIYPIMQIIGMFTNADCPTGPSNTIDLAFFSEVDPLYGNDFLNFLMFPESIVFANPIAQSICTADCAALMAGAEFEQNYFCASCAGNLYPMTGTVTTSDDDAVRNTELLTARLLGVLHRRGQAWLTMGDHRTSGTCEVEYAPMLPKTQYRSSMLYPVPEAQNTTVEMMDGASSVGNSTENNSQTTTIYDQECCHKLGESTWKWGNNRTRPSKNAYVYLIYQWNDCCLR
ncbi:TraU family protein (plasmid) [Vibrio sp. SS-MA-C1-2]|uniref:TraU family protein n=1 Tax=Vibrio sp. SS-MA-C1-2 TaxID=2908646 RepID=UPI001F16B3EB|nr:TraU family protein [Vibrio sp. SS-MA-C1-2]UJF20229.1 TraU family protein [Vibrio sp. SS-MA-C1-2]